MYLNFAWRYFKAKKSANAINIIAWVTVAVIAFATMAQVMVLSVFNGFEGLVKSLYSSFYTDVKIIPSEGKTFKLSAEQINQIRQQPGIAAASTIVEEKGLLQNEVFEGDSTMPENRQTLVTLKGVDENYIKVSGVAAATKRGKFDPGTLEQPGIIVGAGIQESADIRVAENIDQSNLVVILPKKGASNFSNLTEALTEGNAIATGAFMIQQDFDSRYAITNIAFVKQQMGLAEDEFSSIEIKLLPDAKAEDVIARLKKILPSSLALQTKYEQNMSLYNTMRTEKWAIFAIFTLIFIIAAFNMISALTMLVLEKQKDISVLQSLGAGRGMIQRIFLAEGVLLGVIGLVIGSALALLLCLAQMKFHLLKLQGGTFLIDYYPVQIVPTDFLLVGATAFTIALIASWYPSWKASRQPFDLK